jgi:hypothetical protein
MLLKHWGPARISFTIKPMDASTVRILSQIFGVQH